jgi:hypothetical protein
MKGISNPQQYDASLFAIDGDETGGGVNWPVLISLAREREDAEGK